jgi:hypothetical protein
MQIHAGALVFALAVLPAWAQPAPTPQWSEIETVEVKARPGPPVWRLTRGQSEVWVLGLAGSIPKDLDWNQDTVRELMTGARAILLPPQADVGLVDAAWFLMWHGSELSLPRGQTLEPSLPEPLRNRFIAARDAVGKAGDYSTDIPMRAAMRLNQDLADKEGFDYREPGRSIEKLARAAHVANAPVMQVPAMDSVRDVLKMTPQAQQACLAEAVEDVQWALAHARRAAQAWAVGDLNGIKANYAQSRLFDCVSEKIARVDSLRAQGRDTTATAIAEALNKPGKTIAVVNIGNLLRKGGVLERLGGMGVKIEAPNAQ